MSDIQEYLHSKYLDIPFCISEYVDAKMEDYLSSLLDAMNLEQRMKLAVDLAFDEMKKDIDAKVDDVLLTTAYSAIANLF